MTRSRTHIAATAALALIAGIGLGACNTTVSPDGVARYIDLTKDREHGVLLWRETPTVILVTEATPREQEILREVVAEFGEAAGFADPIPLEVSRAFEKRDMKYGAILVHISSARDWPRKARKCSQWGCAFWWNTRSEITSAVVYVNTDMIAGGNRGYMRDYLWHELLHAVGVIRHVPNSWPSVMGAELNYRHHTFPELDRAALHARYNCIPETGADPGGKYFVNTRVTADHVRHCVS